MVKGMWKKGLTVAMAAAMLAGPVSVPAVFNNGVSVVKADETNKEQSLKLKQGDLLSIDKDIHTFENQTDEVVEFIVFRYLPSYKNQSEMIKNDKEIIER